jgi:hypothetical protein
MHKPIRLLLPREHPALTSNLAGIGWCVGVGVIVNRECAPHPPRFLNEWLDGAVPSSGVATKPLRDGLVKVRHDERILGVAKCVAP